MVNIYYAYDKIMITRITNKKNKECYYKRNKEGYYKKFMRLIGRKKYEGYYTK